MIFSNSVGPNPSNYKKIHMIKKTQKNVETYKNLIKDKTKISLKEKFGLKPIDIVTLHKQRNKLN